MTTRKRNSLRADAMAPLDKGEVNRGDESVTSQPDLAPTDLQEPQQSQAENTDKPRGWTKEEADAVLLSPLTYVISAPEALDKISALFFKILEDRPDLATAIDPLKSQVDELKKMADGVVEVPQAPTRGLPGETPAQAGDSVSPGDRVTVSTKDGESTGVVHDVNEDGTYEVQTDDGLKLSRVPAQSVKKQAAEEASTLSLPPNIRGAILRRKLTRLVMNASKHYGIAATAKLLKGNIVGDKKKLEMTEQDKARVEAATKLFKSGKLNLRAMDMYHPAVQETVRGLLKDKKSQVTASAFDKIEKIDLGGGYSAKRGKPAKGEEHINTVVVVDPKGKEVAEYPDAFGDDTVAIIKLLRQIQGITEKEDEVKPTEVKNATSESEKKLKALPETKEEKAESKKEKKEDESKELEAARRAFEHRLTMARDIVSERVRKRWVTAKQDDIDAFLMKGMGLEASMNEALKIAVERDLSRVLSLPDAELPVIRASLVHLQAKAIQVDDPTFNKGGLPFLGGIAMHVAQHKDAPESIVGVAMGVGFGKR